MRFNPVQQPAQFQAPGAAQTATPVAGAAALIDAQRDAKVADIRRFDPVVQAGLGYAQAGAAAIKQKAQEEQDFQDAADLAAAQTELERTRLRIKQRFEELRHTTDGEDLRRRMDGVIAEEQTRFGKEYVSGRDSTGNPFLRDNRVREKVQLAATQEFGKARVEGDAWLFERNREVSVERLDVAWRAAMDMPPDQGMARLDALASDLRAAGVSPAAVQDRLRVGRQSLAVSAIDDEMNGAILASEQDPETATLVLREVAGQLEMTDESLEEDAARGDSRARMLLAIPQVDRKKLAVQAKNIASSTDRLMVAQARAASDEEKAARAALEGQALDRAWVAMHPGGPGTKRRNLAIPEIAELSMGKNADGIPVQDKDLYALLLKEQKELIDLEAGNRVPATQELADAEEAALVELSLKMRSQNLDREQVVAEGRALAKEKGFSYQFHERLHSLGQATQALSPVQKEKVERAIGPYKAHVDAKGSLYRDKDGNLVRDKPGWRAQPLDAFAIEDLWVEAEQFALDNPQATYQQIREFVETRADGHRIKAAGDQVIDQLGGPYGGFYGQ
jgi:hypothetical protein